MGHIESRRPGTSARARRRFALPALAVLLLAVLAVPGAAARTGTRSLTFAGVILTVPSGWPVIDLARTPSACVRFDRHAVYLGRPGGHSACPGHAAGQTEAILIEPLARAGRPGPGPGLGRGTPATLVRRGPHAAVFATWRSGAATIRRALDLPALPAPHPARPAGVGRVAAARAADRARAHGAAATPSGGTGTTTGSPTTSGTGSPTPSGSSGAPSSATAGGVYTGEGFDACSAPSQQQMSAWARSPYRAIGVYIGGANMACAQTNLTAGWISTQASAGWHTIPTYVGLQAPGNSCGCAAIIPGNAASEGAAAAQDAIAQAEALGLGPGNPIYFDMEAYPRTSPNTTAVLNFLAAWTQGLHASGYRSGVYSSENSGIADLAAQYGTSYPEPDDIWIANWNGAHSTSDGNLPAGTWANHQRLHQYQGDHTETYGGVRLDIDGDYLDASTGSPGSGTVASVAAPPPPPPALAINPAPDGSIAISPSWRSGPSVTSWQLLAGPTPTTLSPAASPVSGSSTSPIVVHSAFTYFAVQALDGSDQVIGTSSPVPTPAHLALAGSSAFVPASGLGAVPVACFNSAPCHVAARIVRGHTTLATTGVEYVPPGGGLVFFALSTAARHSLAHAHRLSTTVIVRDSSGLTASRTMTLSSFRTSGRSLALSQHPAPSVTLFGLTDYVSSGWVGGILSACRGASPCHIATTIKVGRTTIATTGSEFLGTGEVGYLIFTLTRQGHALLAAARGNQLAAQVTEVNGSDRATGSVALIAFP